MVMIHLTLTTWMLLSGQVPYRWSLGYSIRYQRWLTRWKNCHPWRWVTSFMYGLLISCRIHSRYGVCSWPSICHRKTAFIRGKLMLILLCCSCLRRCRNIIKYDEICNRQLMNAKSCCCNNHHVKMVHFNT